MRVTVEMDCAAADRKRGGRIASRKLEKIAVGGGLDVARRVVSCARSCGKSTFVTVGARDVGSRSALLVTRPAPLRLVAIDVAPRCAVLALVLRASGFEQRVAEPEERRPSVCSSSALSVAEASPNTGG